ncbi:MULTISPECIES: DUF2254 family protein [unclassified Cryobacterium]|uniref:DUF2254 family protein n=1 Tax=unclassified Cryobacterium TaxID=2649013 RepID=UPI002AB34EBB|nr:MULTISPECIES: DUF2254 family protein [unclassified Cryobacterium]MDY7543767.1 DUF2254 family protein [Cryobacterium sp. 5B3]MEA9997573.1 DUF2254 family protein [Cryobacterium sp. RTS3]MEB0264262.1 DUF2254 family protein [Cryobacterium sp. 10I5]MEB0273444.1 DUF2254 family protein [Cryobacterium sp. 5B3]
MIGYERTAAQDVDYGVHEIVDIAVRALSWGSMIRPQPRTRSGTSVPSSLASWSVPHWRSDLPGRTDACEW